MPGTSHGDPPAPGSNDPETSGPAEPTLDDIARACPRWRCWKGVSGLLYASLRHSSPPVAVRGEDPADLRDSIRRAEAGLT